ncbi:hypothetical protein N4T19_01620 [Comamonas sp. PR12]|uniref:Uncharacterized protein n=1 Tax=Comamonas squillarum TaxID=2977320 RepID=A0ABY5ZYT9_9BURK|nr:hypothetical protein [Comamonas sp. PR12]UXC18859.1 hypothetical protein N4T19_01620 [Comamonas sp. PR12]
MLMITRPKAGKLGMVAVTPEASIAMELGHAAPLMADTHTAATLLKLGGKLSTTLAPPAAPGPLLSMVSTYKNPSPPLADTGPVLVICRSAVCACANAGKSIKENNKKQKLDILFFIELNDI